MKNTFHSNVIIVQSDLKKVTDLSNPIDPFNEFKDLVGSTGANILKEIMVSKIVFLQSTF